MVTASRATATGELIFVCAGNTCRSPMAMAIARHEIARTDEMRVRVSSAGVSVRNAGAPMTAEAEIALRAMSVEPPSGHRSRQLTAEMCENSAAIYCMTRHQRDIVVAMAPDAAGRTFCLDPAADIPDPIGKPVDAYYRCASNLRRLVRTRLEELGNGYPPAAEDGYSATGSAGG